MTSSYIYYMYHTFVNYVLQVCTPCMHLHIYIYIRTAVQYSSTPHVPSRKVVHYLFIK